MKQAVFVDYTGTLVKEDGPDLHGVVRAICANSDEKRPAPRAGLWWQRLKQLQGGQLWPRVFDAGRNCAANFWPICERQLHLQADKAALHAGIRRFWASAPLFEDAPAFLRRARCRWVLTNNSEGCVRENLAAHGIVPAGIVTGTWRAPIKPHPRVF